MTIKKLIFKIFYLKLNNQWKSEENLITKGGLSINVQKFIKCFPNKCSKIHKMLPN